MLRSVVQPARVLRANRAFSEGVRTVPRVKVAPSVKQTNKSLDAGWVALGSTVVGIGGFTWALNSDSEMGRALRNSYAMRWIYANVGEMSRPFSEPVRTKLLPDWPYFPNVPPGTPCPPTLVLDLEGTLCTSVWDHKHGWRHVKRPGVEKFLKEVSRYFEVVIFSPNIAGTVDPIISGLDKENVVIHRLYREATKFHNGAHVKDLSALNRGLKNVLIIDDDPTAYQLQPGNAIHIKPFTDARDKSDSILEDLTPFLRALVNEGVKDYPALLKSFGSNEAADVADRYNSKLDSVKGAREEALQRGLLGGALRAWSSSSDPDKSYDHRPMAASDKSGVRLVRDPGSMVSRVVLKDAEENEGGSAPKVPLQAERKGGLWKRLDGLKKEAEVDNQRKIQAFNDVMLKKEKERMDRG